MEIWDGHTGSDGSPRIVLKLRGRTTQREFTALIDTGFSGFLYIPLLVAIPLGVFLDSLSDATLADGSTIRVLLSEFEGDISGTPFHGEAMMGFQGGNDILLGMEFLRTTDRALFVDGIDHVRGPSKFKQAHPLLV
jgi:predicted aspartyl protease